MSLKEDHEKAVCTSFISIYKDSHENTYNFVRLGDPNKKEPDCICTDDLGIELVGTYDNAYQAEKIWANARGKENRAPTNILLTTFENLTQLIGTKLEKLNDNHYDGFPGKIILLCELLSPLLTDNEVDLYVSSYSSFRSDLYYDRFFDEIWIYYYSRKLSRYSARKLE